MEDKIMRKGDDDYEKEKEKKTPNNCSDDNSNSNRNATAGERTRTTTLPAGSTRAVTATTVGLLGELNSAAAAVAAVSVKRPGEETSTGCDGRILIPVPPSLSFDDDVAPTTNPTITNPTITNPTTTNPTNPTSRGSSDNDDLVDNLDKLFSGDDECGEDGHQQDFEGWDSIRRIQFIIETLEDVQRVLQDTGHD